MQTMMYADSSVGVTSKYGTLLQFITTSKLLSESPEADYIAIREKKILVEMSTVKYIPLDVTK